MCQIIKSIKRKVMKQTIFIIVLSCVTIFNGYAQGGLKYGVVTGVNISNFSSSAVDSKTGFHVGVRAEMPLIQVANNVYLDAMVLISSKGAKADWGDLGNTKINPTYLEIPIHVGYKHRIADNASVFGSVGPYFAFGLFGKQKGTVLDYDDNMNLVERTESYDLFGDNGMKRFDFGLGFNAGVELKQKYRISIAYDFGLTEIYKDSSEDLDLIDGAKNRNLMVSLGYMF